MGPVSGHEDENAAAFDDARKAIRSLGFGKVEIPHDTIPSGTEWTMAMRQSLRRLLEADVVVFLSGTEASKGATVERRVALDLCIPVFSLERFLKLAHEFL